MKIYYSMKEFSVKLISGLVIAFSGLAIVNACTFFFYEDELPEILENEHPFK